jgi:CheY-like chemotaxis protein
MQLNPPTNRRTPGFGRSNGHAPRSPSVLIVDDEPAFCFAMAEILRLNGYEVIQANSVHEALSTLENTMPDLILTDIMMPGSDGLAFIRQLRSRDVWAKIPTIAVSAKAMSQDRDAARDAGADGYLAKPFSAQELQDTIRVHAPPRAA